MEALARLKDLLKDSETNNGDWAFGKIPEHYKRISIPLEKQKELAKIGMLEIFGAYEEVPFFTQAVISGAMLSGEFHKITVVSPWQYGKSWIVGRTALLLARRGEKVSVGANSANLTDMVMASVMESVRTGTEQMKAELIGDSLRKIDKLGQTLNRQRIAFAGGGYVQAMTLAGTYEDQSHNRAMGVGDIYILDEAAWISDDSYHETIRREFSSVEGKTNMMVAISNPHRPGWFYEDLTGDDDPNHLIIWMDALTAVQERRWSKERVLESEAVKSKATITKYLLCELPESGGSMFDTPKIGHEIGGHQFIGVDSAYRGKDNICIARTEFNGGRVHVAEVATVEKKEWIQGKTSAEIIKAVSRVCRACGAENICVDAGQGIWLTEGLEQAGLNVQGIHFNSSPTRIRIKRKDYAAVSASNVRAEMHLDLQSLIESGTITFAPEVWEAVKDAFPFITAELKSNGTYQIEKKEKIKAMIGHSPDELDAVLLSIHAGILESYRPRYIINREAI